MSIHQIHFGRKFYQDKKVGYWISTDYPRIRAHQWVWENHNGKPPKGYHIHHMNDNKSDNRIENLELIRGKRHLEHHMKERMKDPENLQKMRDLAEKNRHLTKSWHKSEEGRAWHRLHAIKSKFGLTEFIDYECQECQKSYKSRLKAKGRTRFCSNACKSRWRRKEGLDDIQKTCPVCQKEFLLNKYSKTKTCSKICGKKNQQK